MYNLFYDSLKHKKYDDNKPIIAYLLKKYNEIINNFYSTLNNDWLIIATTDHGRSGSNNFDHSNFDITGHFSWTLANHDLNMILGHNYQNFYDIRTVVLKWLSSY